MTIMPPPQPSVCEMPLNAVTDCVVVESLRCPYCLAAVEIRQGDNWTTYWCSKHGAIESPISFTDTALADGRISSPAFTCLSAGCLPPPGIPAGTPLPAGLLRIFPDAPGRYEPFSGHESDNRVAGCIARGFEQ